MKTKSCWGVPPKRLYNFINKIKNCKENYNNICIVGCSDGKFVLPFLRNGFDVTAIDFDKTALYGGYKQKPVERNSIKIKKYQASPVKPQYESINTETIEILGLKRRVEIENLQDRLSILETDFYRNPPNEEYDILFTSCSIQYKSNRSLLVEDIMNTLKSRVRPGGFLYMDYMLPLEDSHEWKSAHFFRSGEIKLHFDSNWSIKYIKENTNPIFEAAHVDRSEDHFHRFGYILVQRLV